MKKTPMPHIGEMLHQYFITHRTYKSILAERIGKDKTTLQRYIFRPSLQAHILWDVCHGLQHNFFQDLADLLPSDYATNAVKETNENAEVERLQGELNLAKAQITMLYDIVMGKKELPKRE